MQVKQTDDDLIDRTFGKNRVRMVLNINAVLSASPPRSFMVAAIVYWDPRSTHDLGRPIIHDQISFQAWGRGLLFLKHSPAPRVFAHAVLCAIQGITTSVEPLLVTPTHLSRIADHLHSENECPAEAEDSKSQSSTSDGLRIREGGVIKRYGSKSKPRVQARASIVERGGRIILIVHGIVLNEKGIWEKNISAGIRDRGKQSCSM